MYSQQRETIHEDKKSRRKNLIRDLPQKCVYVKERERDIHVSLKKCL